MTRPEEQDTAPVEACPKGYVLVYYDGSGHMAEGWVVFTDTQDILPQHFATKQEAIRGAIEHDAGLRAAPPSPTGEAKMAEPVAEWQIETADGWINEDADLIDLRIEQGLKVRALYAHAPDTEALRADVERLTRERDAWEIASRKWMARTLHAEEALADAEKRGAEMAEALEPFADYMRGGFDHDNKGNPLPDEQGVGWLYLTHGSFRRAQAVLERARARAETESGR